MSAEKLIEDNLKNAIINEASSVEEGLNNFDRIRLFAQGATFNFSDEVFAGIKALYENRPYEEIVKEERRLLEQARDKDGSLKYELSGAVGSGILMAPFTFGASLPATIGRTALIAGTSGLTSSIGEKEGGIVDRITENKADIAIDTAGSAILGPLAGKGVDLIGGLAKSAIGPLVRNIKSQLGSKVEDEILRIGKGSGMNADEIIVGVLSGKTFTELNPNIANDIRAIFAKGGPAGGIIGDAVTKRTESTTDKVTDMLSKGLNANLKKTNILELVQKSSDVIKRRESKAYKKVFDKFKNLNNPELNNLVIDTVNRYRPALVANTLNRVLKAEGQKPLFKKGKDGFELDGNVSLESGENIYRILRDTAIKLSRTSGTEPEVKVVRQLAMGLKNKLDEVSPELKATRFNWAKIEEGKNLFDAGRKLLSKNADEAEIDINNVIRTGDKELLESFKQGIASNIQNKIKGSPTGKGNFIKRLNNPESKERLIIEKIFPKDQIEDLIKGVDINVRAMNVQQKILGQSPTAVTEARGKAVGTLSDAGDLYSAVQFGDVFAGARLIKKFFPNATQGLNQDQLTKVAELAVSENPTLLQKALNDASARERALEKVNAIIQRIKQGVVTGTGQTLSSAKPNVSDSVLSMSAMASERDDNIVPEFVKGLSTSAKRKILDAIDNT